MTWLLKNFWLKVVAFGLGLLVWVHVATEKTYNYEFALPIMEITLADGLALSKPPPESLVVAVSASGKQLLRRKWRQQGVRINASQFQAGRFNLNLTTQNSSLIYLAADVVLEEIISPATMRLEIDRESTVELPVVVDLDLTADEGFAVGRNIKIEPALVNLIGPRTILQTVGTISTERSHLGSLRNSITLTLPLAPPDGYGFKLEPESVLVTVSVFPIKTRIYDDIPILVFNAPGGSMPGVKPARLRLEITGPPDEIDKLDPNAITLSVDYRQRDTANMVAVKFDCPPGFKLKSIAFDSVKITDFPHANPGY